MRRGFRGGAQGAATRNRVCGDPQHADAWRPNSDERGQVLVLFVLMFAVLLGCSVMVIDVGSFFRGMVEGLNVKMTGSAGR